jgi:prevent-host-death family protein
MGSTIVNVHEAKTHLSRLLERAHRGEVIVLAKGGVPYARLVPLEESSARPFGVWASAGELKQEFFDTLPGDELDAWDGATD